MSFFRFSFFFLCACLSFNSLQAQSNLEGIHFFEKNIRPLLLNECSKCHGEKKQKADLRLDAPQFIAKGGSNGQLFIPHDSKNSLILKVVRREITELEMPPKKHLSQAQVEKLKQWVELGAPLPKFDPIANKETDKLAGNLEEVKKHWSFQPIQKHTPPKADQKLNNVIDHFIHEKLNEKLLSFSPKAKPSHLLRRLSLNLVGLPPNQQQIDQFNSKPLEQAYPEMVEQLLSSKHYGEKWGKHWLNLVRYAESTGKDENHRLPHAHTYRSYVIQAFNEDLPFDQFITQQIASDLIPNIKSEEQKIKITPATAFNSFGPKNIAERDLDQLCMDVIDEQLDNVSLTFLGLTMSCARCHDHKFDPISTKEYYALAGIFKSSQTLNDWTPTAIKQHYSKSLLTQKQQEHNQPFQKQLEPLVAKYKKLEKVNYKSEEQKQEMKKIEGEIKAIEKEMIPDERSYVLNDFPANAKESDLSIQDCRIHVRGSYQNQKGEPIPRSPPYVFDNYFKTSEVPENQSGRLQLAEWVANPKNPLTARVIVNRIWTWHFGTGLVRSTSNFGTTGEAPSHPELLDYLANYFIENNWSVKQLHRLILNSSTFQQSYRQDRLAQEVDPERRLLWSFPEQRLDAEIIRDRMMSVSGELKLNPTPVGSINALGKRKHDPSFDNNTNRSVYLSVVRNKIHPMFRIFNFTTASMPIPQRENSSLSTQPLFLNNSSFVYKQAQRTATKILKEPKEKRFESALSLIYSRPASTKESQVLEKYYNNFFQKHKSEHKAWTLLVQSMFQTHEFLNIN